MKFVLFPLPTVPAASLEERKALRPISARTERFQMMIDEVTELAQMAEDLGFDAIAFPEHHLHSEGLEMGCTPSWLLYVAMKTNHLKVGPIGYVLGSWDPLRLAVEIGWLDQLTKGRTFVGFARGYQDRWYNNMAPGQFFGVQSTHHEPGERDARNRRIFEEVFQVLKLAWSDEPFSFKGEFYQYPNPYDEGTEWPPAPWTLELGAPGEVDPETMRVRKMFVVPKPYQKPHPPLWQAFSISEATIRWTARQNITPAILTPYPPQLRQLAEAYVDEGAKAGRKLRMGESIGVLKTVYFKEVGDPEDMAMRGLLGVGFRNFWFYFGFGEAFRLPQDEEKWPFGKALLPLEEITFQRAVECDFAFAGTVDDVLRRVEALEENVNPEWFVWLIDQGLLSRYELKRELELFGRYVIPRFKH